MVLELLSPLSAAIGCLLLFSIVRTRARNLSIVRVRQLKEAAALLTLHAGALDRFLSHAASPEYLQRVLVDYSEAMACKELVLELAKGMSCRSMEGARSGSDPGYERIEAELRDLRVGHPNLVDDFAHAGLTIAYGSVLRWPESAALVEQFGARLAANPKGNIDVVAAALRSAASFATGQHPPAVA